jgi:hypothetical protein
MSTTFSVLQTSDAGCHPVPLFDVDEVPLVTLSRPISASLLSQSLSGFSNLAFLYNIRCLLIHNTEAQLKSIIHEIDMIADLNEVRPLLPL